MLRTSSWHRWYPCSFDNGSTYRSTQHTFGDSNLYLRRLAHDGSLELKIEHRAAAPPPPFRLKLVVDDGAATARFTPAERDQQNDPTAGRVLALIAGAPGPLSSAALREKLGVRDQLVADALRALADTGQIRRAGRDGWVQRAS